MDKSTKGKKQWVCEECGREFDKLPFPSECKCGNWCEDYFREKDRYDFEDDKLGRPLHGVKYDIEVLKERNARLKKQGITVVQTIEEDEVVPTIEEIKKSKKKTTKKKRKVIKKK